MKGGFEDRLRSKLHDYERPGEVPRWEAMQRRMALYANAHPPMSLNRSRRGMWYGVAAAVMLAVVSGIWLGNRSVLPETQRLSEMFPPALSGLQPARSAETTDFENPVLDRIFKSAKKIALVDPLGTADVPMQVSSQQDTISTAGVSAFSEESSRPDASGGGTGTNERSVSGTYTPDKAAVAAYRQKFAGPERNGRFRRNGRNWVASFYASASTFSGAAEGIHAPKTLSLNAGLYDVATVKSVSRIDSRLLDHRVPVSIGLNVRKYVVPRVGVETGLVYTYMHSTADLEKAFSYRYDQKLHYLGIPLSVSYSVLDSRRFELYFSGGVLAEFPISARGTTRIFNGPDYSSTVNEKLSTGGMLWSVNLGTGIGWKVVDRFGLYFEPGINYYFENKNQPLSYRTENPWNVNLKVGLRFHF